MSQKPYPEISPLNHAYFEGNMLGELRLRRCLACAARFRFAHDLCPICWSPALGWDKAAGRGKISHFSIVHQAPSPAFAQDIPYVIALIELDENVRMMSNITGCAPEEIHIGMAVEVYFEPRGDTSIPLFRPASTGTPQNQTPPADSIT